MEETLGSVFRCNDLECHDAKMKDFLTSRLQKTQSMKNYFFLLLFMVSSVIAQTDKDLVEESVNAAEVKAQISFLASDELKGRDTPSEGQETAAKFIATQMAMYGVKAYSEMPDYIQRVPFTKSNIPSMGAIAVDDQTYTYAVDFLKMAGGNIDWSGDIIMLKHASPEEIAKEDVKGKMIVAACGDGKEQSPQAWFGMSSDKRKAAEAAGAAGLIEFYNSPQIPWQLLVRYLNREQISLDEGNETSFPSFWLLDTNREATEKFKGQKEVSVKIEGANNEKFTAPNVVGFVEGSDAKLKEEYVVYCAHFDHVGIGPANAEGDSIFNGARDNAVGSVAVLQAAKNIAMNPTKRSALFVFFTGEEKGLLGSRYFVENSPLAINKMVFCNNVDGAGYNDTSKVTIIGLPRTTAEENIKKACAAFGLEAIDDPVPEQGLFDRSDNVNFARKGVPAPDFSMGLTAFDGEIQKYYHQQADNPETLDMDYLVKYWSAYVLTGRLIANDKKKPFWTEGDKYYEAGMQLYK